MPRGNGTGPLGLGPFTGWGRGNCIMPYENYQRARYMGRPWRMRGRFARPDSELDLVNSIKKLEESIEELKMRLDEQAKA